jgi:hypothetical protein
MREGLAHNRDVFRGKFRHQLPLALRDSLYLKNILSRGAGTSFEEAELYIN